MITSSIKYVAGALVIIPLFPLMLYQGKRIRKSVPKLPEATGNEGLTDKGTAPLTIVTIGESTVAGVGVKTHKEGFTGTLAQQLADITDHSIKWKVYAKSGFTAKMVTQRLIPTIKERRVDLIVVGLGGNDAFTLNRPDKWKKDMNHLIHKLRSIYPTTSIVFLNMPPIKAFPAFTPLIRFTLGNLVEILGKELNSLVKAHKNVYYYSRVITIDDWIKRLNINESPKNFFSDGVHPSKLTYQTWAKDTASYILDNKIITIKEST